LITDAARKTRPLRQLKTNVMSSRGRADVHASVEPRGDDSDTAFARGATGSEYRRQPPVLLCQTQFRNFFDHDLVPIDPHSGGRLVAINRSARPKRANREHANHKLGTRLYDGPILRLFSGWAVTHVVPAFSGRRLRRSSAALKD
jgi:hypothetical protein